MNVTIHSRESIEVLLQSGFPENTALIGFYDINNFKNASFHNKEQHSFLIPLKEIDVDELKHDDFEYWAFFRQADELAKFIYSVIIDDLDIICQCEFEQSYSAGCAAAILEHFEGNGTSIFSDDRYNPNEIVYHKLLDALKKYGEVELIGDQRFLIHNKELIKYLGRDKKVTIPESVKEISFDAFRNRIELEELVISKNVKELHGKTFEYCINLKSISVDKRNKHFDSRNNCNAVIKSFSNELVLGCKNTVIPDTVIRINEFAFSDCPSKVILPESVTSLAFMAFSYCSNLKEIFIPYNTTEIEDMVFFGSDNIKKIVVDSRNKVYDSRNNCNAIIETALNKLIIGCKNTIMPNDVCIIEGMAFASLDEITEVKIPESVIIIDPTSFFTCRNIESITVDRNNMRYDSRDNCNAIIDTVEGKLILGCKNTVIAEGVKIIGQYSFDSCEGLEKITIPESVKIIEAWAFFECDNFSEIMIPNSVTEIGHSAFSVCEKLTVNCYSGSYAEKYAKENNMKYKLIDKA